MEVHLPFFRVAGALPHSPGGRSLSREHRRNPVRIRYRFLSHANRQPIGRHACRIADGAGALQRRIYFCESVEVTAPLGRSAQTLDEFRHGIALLSHSGFYFHFISSRLRLQLRTNDFSHWLADGLGPRTLAESVNTIDIYTNTLDSTRAKLLRLIDRERRKHE